MRKARHLLPLLILSLLPLLGGCDGDRQCSVFCERDEIRLQVGGSVVFAYEPNTCQLAFSRDKREFRAFTDSMSDFFVAELSAIPTQLGQRLTADLTWTTDWEVLTRKNLTLEVARLEGDEFWLWSTAGRIGVTVRILE
ncbi:MAG: hypothetical protein J6W98_06315 [Bacteroidales bacterium]|nr:hypothetical protein [Bacteroidales bacterium]